MIIFLMLATSQTSAAKWKKLKELEPHQEARKKNGRYESLSLVKRIRGCPMDSVHTIYYEIRDREEGSPRTTNLYYVINGQPLTMMKSQMLLRMKSCPNFRDDKDLFSLLLCLFHVYFLLSLSFPLSCEEHNNDKIQKVALYI